MKNDYWKKTVAECPSRPRTRKDFIEAYVDAREAYKRALTAFTRGYIDAEALVRYKGSVGAAAFALVEQLIEIGEVNTAQIITRF